MNFSREFDEASRLIHRKNNILLASHERPDGDALGSMAAMFSVLQEFPEKRIVMFSQDSVPENLKFLPHANEIVNDWRAGGFVPDLFLAFDYGDFKRLGVPSEEIGGVPIVTFDHHPFLRQMGDIMIIDPDASSTCEMLYKFLYRGKYHISMQAATCLLAGIFTDTGGFAHINTSIETLNVAGDLLRCGASMPKLKKYTFSSKSPHTLRVWGAMLRNILYDKEIGMAYVVVPYKNFMEMGSSLDDFSGVVNVINMPPDVRFSLMLIEHRPGEIKGSLRSEPFKKIDVSKIANALGGGGHKYAAGFEIREQTLKNAVECVKIIFKRQETSDK